MNNKPITSTTECSNCGGSTTTNHRSILLLHHVRLRGSYRRFCTSCVLKLHPGSFCPICFDLFDTSPPPNHHRVICQKCPSISHPTCVSPSSSSSSEKAYTCPPCSSPNFSFFDVKKKTQNDVVGGGEVGKEGVIDKKAARVLLCAARIAAVSMSKAVVVARAEAERRVREAALSRKRAREALEHVAGLVAKEKAKQKEGSASASVNVGVKEKNSEGNGGIMAGGVAEMKSNGIGRERVMDSFGEVSANLNSLGLREKEKDMLVFPKDGEMRKVSNADGVGHRMEVQNRGGGMTEKDRGNELTNLDRNSNAEGEKAKNGLFSVPSVGVQQLQHLENSYGRNEEVGSK